MYKEIFSQMQGRLIEYVPKLLESVNISLICKKPLLFIDAETSTRYVLRSALKAFVTVWSEVD